MTALYVETLLLMTGAYVLGAALACLVRRAIAAAERQPAPARPVEPLPGLASATARFGRSADAPAGGVPPQAVPAAAAAIKASEDLQRIRGIDADTEARLNALDVRRYGEIAAFTPQDVRRIGDALGSAGRINRENWIEQAQVLASGGATNFARRRARGETASASPTANEGEGRMLAESRPVAADAPLATGDTEVAIAVDPPPAPPPVETAAPPPARTPEVADRAAFAARQPAAMAPASPPTLAPAVPVRSPPAAHDNLLRIRGIDARIAALLAERWVSRYSQIAHWSAADVTRFESQLGVVGRIARENWIEQAQILGRGGDTAYSREFDRDPARGEEARESAPDAEKAADKANVEEHATAPIMGGFTSPADLRSLRSVRSEAYRYPEPGPQAAQRLAAQDKVLRSMRRDDLKRIRGIGVLIEKKLNSMGIVAYEQIANWTADDIDRVSQSLDFKGRIERENWVEQARILASGGATEFASRVDREAGTGRPRG
jgi:predicted flap endonuclease-1-like 5' DNA nuclease